MQQPPRGQHAPPPQQSCSLDEIDVALVTVMTAAIKSKYFIISPVRISLHLGHANAPSRIFGEIRPAAAAPADDRLVPI
jgi:hypothetical protein